ncbi:uncharacterized protein LOC142540094 [Primulina tabacum]|uniref:uncharacterized protein LOC142540094 n=1 Tax=Primulina tabacum TaxID=48773 RepID=UPI003F59977B
MNRFAVAKRLLPAFGQRINRFQNLTPILTNPTLFSTAAGSETVPNQNPNPFTSSSTSAGARESGARKPSSPKDHWQDEQARVLHASLGHVIRLGWTDAAMISGARDVGVSPSIVGSFPRKEASLVEFFMDDCLQRLINIVETDSELESLILSQRVSKLVRIRLEMQAPCISKWPQALSIQAQPFNISASFKQRAMLVDEIWHASGDKAVDIDWYVKRTVLGGIYSTTELYMLTDTSPDFQNTWAFLDGRIKDAFDMKNTVQEVKYLAEAVGAGMGSSVQGFVKRVFQS